MAEVVWPDEVFAKLDEIANVIALDNPTAAERIVTRLLAAGESLAQFPHRGRPASGGVRELAIVPPYLIRYRVVGDTVVVVSIRHGRQRPLP